MRAISFFYRSTHKKYGNNVARNGVQLTRRVCGGGRKRSLRKRKSTKAAGTGKELCRDSSDQTEAARKVHNRGRRRARTEDEADQKQCNQKNEENPCKLTRSPDLAQQPGLRVSLTLAHVSSKGEDGHKVDETFGKCG